MLEPYSDRSGLSVTIRGAVQGVGFRPFVFRLAAELGLEGWVSNDNQGVKVEVDGERAALESFLRRVTAEMPAAATVESTAADWRNPAGHRGFEIRRSDAQGDRTVQILPELATCEACRTELLDRHDRRYRYPFTNCTLCGPRFTIIRSLPYDRPRTTMRRFKMCAACRAEYDSPLDRRFHAQPNACPDCGPQLALWNAAGVEIAAREAALAGAVAALARGEIVAVKGLGGFHLMADARHGAAVSRLREKKPRRAKPFALMVRNLDQARELCRVGEAAARALESPEAPILLLPRRANAAVHAAVAPGSPYLGIMLPYSPLHHLILEGTGFPVVATSGNLSEEPICTREEEAADRLGGIADAFLVHDRPIARHVDDSVAWLVNDEVRLLRRARGYAPRPVRLEQEFPTILAVGGHLKNSVSFSFGRQVFISQHIGDMESAESLAAFEGVIDDFLRLWGAAPVAIAHDLHPDYATTRFAIAAAAGAAPGDLALRLTGARLVPVQHHHAHLAACLAENDHRGPALGVTWDGTGFGTDGTVWGGEFLLGTAAAVRRVATLRPFRLPGGDAAVREPRRSALALLHEAFGEQALAREDLPPVRAFSNAERRLLGGMLARGVNSPLTSSAGRLFDGVSALLGLVQQSAFEGQAAMALEFAADPDVRGAYPIDLTPPPAGATEPVVLDWRPTIECLLDDRRRGVAVPVLAARFHGALVEAIVRVAEISGVATIALSGGCFQNRLLTERALERLEDSGYRVLLHRQVPPNDGCISLGQIAVAAARLAEEQPAEPT